MVGGRRERREERGGRKEKRGLFLIREKVPARYKDQIKMDGLNIYKIDYTIEPKF